MDTVYSVQSTARGARGEGEAGKREKETGEKAIAGINSDIRVISAQQSASLLENALRVQGRERQDSVQILMH